MTKQTKKQLGLIAAFIITFAMSLYADAAQYLECASKDIKTCTKEVSKGAALKGILLDNGKKYLKVEFQTVNEKKGTLVKDSE